MKTLVLAFAMMLSLFAFRAMADEMSGYISAKPCLASVGRSDDHKSCALRAVRQGAPAVFVKEFGGREYKIDDQDKVRDFVGDEVTISGQLEGDTLKIDKITKK